MLDGQPNTSAELFLISIGSIFTGINITIIDNTDILWHP